MDQLLDAITRADASFTIDTLGESIIYRPAGLPERTINAIVDRKPIERVTGAGLRLSIRIQCSTDPFTGIDPATINFDEDHVYVQYVRGQKNGTLDNDPQDSDLAISRGDVDTSDPGTVKLTLV